MDSILARKQSKVEKCTFVKTVLMLIIVLYHSILFWSGNWFSAVVPSVVIHSAIVFSGWLSTFHVYCFVLVSGYLYSYLRFEKDKYKRFGIFLKGKVLRLLIPYIFVSVFWVIPIGQVFYHLSIKEILNKYLLGEAPSQLWFLLMLFLVFMFVWPISHKIHNSIMFSIIISGITYASGLVGARFINNYFQIWTAFQFVLFFVLGMKLRDVHCKGKLLDPKWYYLLGLLGVDVLLYVIKIRFLNKEGAIYSCATLFDDVILSIIGSLLVFFVLQSLSNKFNYKEISKSKWIIKFAESSMIIYLFHQQIIYVSISIFNNLINPYLNMFINFVVSLFISFVISLVFTSNKYLRFLVGEKSRINDLKIQ